MTSAQEPLGPRRPRADAARRLPGPGDVREEHLANGMLALIRENHDSPSVVTCGLVRSGALCDPPQRPGLASFTAAMLERGTVAHSFASLSAELEAISAEVDFSAGRHTLGFDTRCLADDLGTVLGLTAEMIARPAFPAEQIERLRGQILTGLAERDDDTGWQASQAFRGAVYGPDHPYARDPDGTTEGVSAIGPADVSDFHERFVQPRGGIVVIVGAVRAEDAVAMLADSLGAWSPLGTDCDAPVPDPPEHREQQLVRVAMPGKTQSDIYIGNPSIPRRHPDFLAASMANAVLGVFGLMGRLGDNVRDRLGLAYHAYSVLSGGLGPGPWYATAAVNPAHCDKAIEAVLDEMRRLRDEPISESELDDARAFSTGSLPLQLETNDGVAHALLDIALFDLGLDYLQRYGGLVAALTPADLQRAAEAHLHPDTAAIAIAGPPSGDR